MQIQGLHKNIYRLANYALSQEKYELRRKRYETPVCKWHKLGFPIKYVGGGISRATYYCYERHLRALAKEIAPLSLKPKTFRKVLWG
jgi:hypothetical protein